MRVKKGVTALVVALTALAIGAGTVYGAAPGDGRGIGAGLRPSSGSGPSSRALTPRSPAVSAGADGWNIVSSPDLPGGLRSSLASASCLAATDCWAVGEKDSAGDYSTPLAEHWNGASWSIVAPPAPSGTLNSTLYAVSCASAVDCWAAGLYAVTGGSGPLAEHWNGTSWALDAPAKPTGIQFGGLRGVTCVSGSDCWAVGWWYGSAGSDTLIEHWNGTSWSIVTGASVSTSASPQLNGVACSSASACWAVGSSTPVASPQALIEQWNGVAWSTSSAAAPTASQSDTLTGVTCASPTACWAVGSYQLQGSGTSQALIESLSGTSWTVTSPSDASPATAASLAKVACLSTMDCDAAGYDTPAGGANTPLVDHWNGSSWSSGGAATPSGDQRALLSGIACGGAVCEAVGSQVTNDGFDTSLVEQLATGTWSAGSAPVPTGTDVNALSAVTCTAGPTCFAVGSHSSQATADTLVERWTGGAWSVVPSDSVGGGLDSFLNAVTCVDSTRCWAVGDVEPNSGKSATPLIEDWDGAKWSIVTAQNPTGSQITVLTGVSCVSATDCFAVGYYAQIASSGLVFGLNQVGAIVLAQTLVEHWNGQSWAMISSPDTSPAKSNVLLGVTCVSATDCWAVGYAEGTSTFGGLVEQWNGNAWSIVASPQTMGNQSSGLLGVACTSDTACWAVGYSYLGSGVNAKDFQTYVEAWDGHAWSVVQSPNIGADQVDVLFAVTCASAQDCAAVGAYGAGPLYQTLALQWDGSAWKVVSSADPPSSLGAFLYGDACTATAGCWSAGNFNESDGTLQTLVEERSNAPGQPVPDVPVTWPLLAAGASLSAAALLRRRRRLLPIPHRIGHNGASR